MIDRGTEFHQKFDKALQKNLGPINTLVDAKIQEDLVGGNLLSLPEFRLCERIRERINLLGQKELLAQDQLDPKNARRLKRSVNKLWEVINNNFPNYGDHPIVALDQSLGIFLNMDLADSEAAEDAEERELLRYRVHQQLNEITGINLGEKNNDILPETGRYKTGFEDGSKLSIPERLEEEFEQLILRGDSFEEFMARLQFTAALYRKHFAWPNQFDMLGYTPLASNPPYNADLLAQYNNPSSFNKHWSDAFPAGMTKSVNPMYDLDGTNEETVVVKDLHGNSINYPPNLAQIAGQALSIYISSQRGLQLWKP